MQNYIAIGLCSLLVSCSSSIPECSDQRVSEEIIKDARPSMGALEVTFWGQVIEAACTKHGLAVPLCVAKIAQESGFNQHAVSERGARCAAQIMPMHYKTPADVKEIEACLELGASILAKEFQNCPTAERALRCYYAGPTNSKKGTLDRVGPYDLKAYSDSILARVAKASAKACPQFNNLLVAKVNK